MRDQIVKKIKCGTIGRVEEHFLRHMKGSRWRGSHRRSPERLFRGSAETKTPKNALAGLEWHKHKWRVARRRQARLEVEARYRKVLPPALARRRVRFRPSEKKLAWSARD